MIPQISAFFLASAAFIMSCYPVYYLDKVINLGYTSILFFSRAQIVYGKLRKNVMDNMYINIFCKYAYPDIIKTIEFVKDGDVIHRCVRMEASLFEGEYDFLIDTTHIYKPIYRCIPESFDNFSPSMTRFIMMEIVIKDERFKINLVNDIYNYAVVGNMIDRAFLIYFLRKHYLNDIYNKIHRTNAYPLDNYSLDLIDDNVNMLTLGSSESFTYLHDKYEKSSDAKTAVDADTSLESDEKSSSLEKDNKGERLEIIPDNSDAPYFHDYDISFAKLQNMMTEAYESTMTDFLVYGSQPKNKNVKNAQ